jgi:hypothetical protein
MKALEFIKAVAYIIGGAILLAVIVPVEAAREIYRRVKYGKIKTRS